MYICTKFVQQIEKSQREAPNLATYMIKLFLHPPCLLNNTFFYIRLQRIVGQNVVEMAAVLGNVGENAGAITYYSIIIIITACLLFTYK